MTDVHEPKVRSYNMSRIRSKDTKPELIVRKYLFRNGFRYRLHVKNLPGKPDVVLPRFKTVIFINGCFWHGHSNCKYYVLPMTRTEFWKKKIQINIDNDNRNVKMLMKNGWQVITIWECQLRPEICTTTLANLALCLVDK